MCAGSKGLAPAFIPWAKESLRASVPKSYPSVPSAYTSCGAFCPPQVQLAPPPHPQSEGAMRGGEADGAASGGGGEFASAAITPAIGATVGALILFRAAVPEFGRCLLRARQFGC